MPHWSSNRAAGSTQLMIRFAGELGVPVARCVAGAGLPQQALVDPSYEIEGQQELAVLRNILRALPPDVAFGLQAGLRYHITTHGMWGFALLSSPTFRSAIEVGVRFGDLSYSFNRISFELDRREARILYEDADNPDDLRAALVERDMAAGTTLRRDLLGQRVPILSLTLRGARPAYAAAFEGVFGVTPRWNAEVNCMTLDAAALEAPQPLADERGLRACEEQCRALLERRGAQSGLAGRVRLRMLRKPGEFPSMCTVAAELGMTTRTLRNQLGREHKTYRELVEETRAVLATELLRTTGLTVDEVGQRLGYADASSFTTAFKRWKGVSPSSYRDARQD